MPPAVTMPPSLLGATIDHLQRFAPFSRMEQGHPAFLVQRLELHEGECSPAGALLSGRIIELECAAGCQADFCRLALDYKP